MNIEHIGSFRTRVADDGSLEVWARGWRLESQLYALIPMGIALMFLLAPMSLPMRVVGAGILVGATLFVFRMTKPGLVLTPEAISIVSVIRTQRFPWEQVNGFIGERRHDEARVLMVLEDQRQIPLPGTLDPEELDPYGDEGQMLSAADQLNHLRGVAISGDLPAPVPVAQASAAPARVGDSGESRKDRRREQKELRAALKAVRLPKAGAPSSVPVDEEPDPPRRRRRRSRTEPAPELLEVAIAEPEPVAVRTRREKPATEGLPSYFPTPTYIPQAEYAQMLRDQKAAEKAAAEASAELARLAGLEELAKKEEFSDWTS
ncbi:MAG: hypothetical protein K0R20_1533 [Actinomycetia bacterium]|jgi:hypothetical protein|nr:hypothetical protein [Actinomycetes bacterium]